MVDAVPPPLPGLDPDWSNHINVTDAHGHTHRWHFLDTGAAPDTVGTIIAVHGNPSWSYMFRHILAAPAPGWRVIAVDQLDMGYSARTERPRSLSQRIDDLGDIVDALNIDGPIIVLAHDWGGPVSLGWAEANRDRLAGIILANTAVHQPAGAPAPAVIRAARTRALLGPLTVGTRNFIRSGLLMSRPAIPSDIRGGYYAPYANKARRAGIKAFVQDIPLDPSHRSAATLDRVAAGLPTLAGIPTLLAWGPKDLVFSDLYLHDLIRRLPHADVTRYPNSAHFVIEDAPTFAADIANWITTRTAPHPADPDVSATDTGSHPAPLWAALDARADDLSAAVTAMSADGTGETTSWRVLSARVRAIAAGLAGSGMGPGDRVALLIRPGADMAAALYGVWRSGGVVILIDPGLGIAGMRAALRGAGPDWVIGSPAALGAVRAFGIHATFISTGTHLSALGRAAGARLCLGDIEKLDWTIPDPPELDDEAAVAFTSGATGPAKGVSYTHRALGAQRDILAATYRLRADDRLLAAFAPFALFGPALGLPSATPAMDMTKPSTLSATALVDAVHTTGATVVFASPSALTNVVATWTDMPGDTEGVTSVRLLLSAGAPVRPALLAEAADLLGADGATPYGMTETLPVATIDLAGLAGTGTADGVCVGHPVAGIQVTIDITDTSGRPTGAYTQAAGQTGEICVNAPWGKTRYDRAYFVETATRTPQGAHRTGDIGHFDDEGRLWVEGRAVHTIVTSSEALTCYRIENRVAAALQTGPVAAVGVGPVGAQTVVIVVEQPGRKAGLASPELRDAVRKALPDIDVATVLTVAKLPVDIRHESKIDRTRVARWAGNFLSGHRGGAL